MQLSKDFTLEQFTKSATAIRKGINNTPTEQQAKALRYLSQTVLQPAHDAGISFFISSGFRCLNLNTALGSKSNSQHPKGEAADLDSNGNESNSELFNFIAENCVFDQLIWEFGTDDQPDWVHVSAKPEGNRMQKLQSVKRNGKTVYLPY